MKDIRLALTALLKENATVNGIVAGRVYPNQLPQGQRSPSVVFHKVAGSFGYTMSGSSGLIQHLMQVDSIAEKHNDATLLANAVHDLLSGFKGEVLYGTNSPRDSVIIQGIFQTNSTDLFDNTTQLHRVVEDYAIWYQEN